MYTTTGITTELITEFDEFAACRDSWNQLGSDRLFHSWEWMFSWWECFRQTGDLAIVTVIDQSGRWIGIAPWFKTVSASRGQVIRALGSGAACSDYVSVVSRPGFEAIVAEKLLEIMFGDQRPAPFESVDLFEFEGHLVDDPVMKAMTDGVSPTMSEVIQDEFAGTWRTRLPRTWQDFDSGLRKSFRRKTKKATRRLDSVDFEAKVFWSPEAIDQIWPVFVDLHQRRRQSLGQPGCFAEERFELFLKNASLRLAQSARAQINVVYHDGRPLTCNLEFSSGDSMYMYQTGMDPDRMSLEPGHITFCRSIQESIERQFTWFDFLRGDEPYKRFWNCERVGLCRTRFVPNRLRANVRHSIFTAGQQIRDWTRTVTGRTDH